MSVLLCDDEIMNRKVASKILIKEGYEVIEAKSAKESYNVLEKTKVSLILMDLMMPHIDGYEAIKHIKAQKELSKIPIIIISALSSKEAIMKGFELGADAYLSKPFDISDFVMKVKKFYKEQDV